MFLGEPPATQADLHFRVFGFPVRVHPFFWIVALLMGLGSGPADPQKTLIWIGVVFVSVLIHELGHASVQRLYGGHPWITLYSFGGLASCNDGPRTPWRRILVLLAGPGAGFLLAALVVAAMKLSGHVIGFGRHDALMNANWLFEAERVLIQPLGPLAVYFEPVKSELFNEVIAKVLEVNIMWGVINLLPVYPLDGGQITRELFTIRNSRFGTVHALQLSAGIAVLIAAYALLNQKIYLALLFGYLAYGNFQALQLNRNRWQ
ncbi:MAG TPA: site-2 protease family protein [Lacipirellulaceae bacterium]|jgi:membrane-associated protease RseP (regulator of RpoE activity)|nr:site-2 protease family protein [Lacipirellulaceae bacterium]